MTFSTPAFAGVTTGISAHDRALTARSLADPAKGPTDFTRPGHLVPLRAKDGGVLARRGHTEASVGEWRKPTGPRRRQPQRTGWAAPSSSRGLTVSHSRFPFVFPCGADLCRLAGLPPAGVICELVKPDDPEGSMAKRDDCFAFAREWGLKMISIEQLVEYRTQKGETL